MISHIYPLEKEVSFYLHQLVKGEAPLNLPTIRSICEALVLSIPALYKQHIHPAYARFEFNNYFQRLIDLHDGLFGVEQAAEALACIQQLMAEHMRDYAKIIEPTRILPLHYREKLQQIVDTSRLLIMDKLQARKIEAAYIYEIDRGLAAPFEAGNLNRLSFHHRNYLPKLIKSLLLLVTHKKDKDWNIRLQQVLVNNNFNYMGLYNAWERVNDQLFDKIESVALKERLVLSLERKLRHFAPDPEMAYVPGVPTLLQHLQRYVKDKKKEIKREKKEAAKPKAAPMVMDAPQVSALGILPAAENPAAMEQELPSSPTKKVQTFDEKFTLEVQTKVREWIRQEEPFVPSAALLCKTLRYKRQYLWKHYLVETPYGKQSLTQFIMKSRVEEVIRLIREQGREMNDAILHLGYHKNAHFYEHYKKVYGTPFKIIF